MKQLLLIILTLLTLNCFGTITKVTRVIDGDTFETDTGEKVRLVGINAPEIRDIFGEEAKQHLISLIENKTVDLEVDHISSDRDRYGRLLRYVILNNSDINKQMVLDGYAFAYLKYHFDKEEEYKQAELISKQENKGIWNNQQSKAIEKEQVKNDNNIFPYFTLKNILVTALVLILLIAGVYYYYKK